MNIQKPLAVTRARRFLGRSALGKARAMRRRSEASRIAVATAAAAAKGDEIRSYVSAKAEYLRNGDASGAHRPDPVLLKIGGRLDCVVAPD